ncbi:hypothetical protein C9975_03490 [Thalassospira xiamenensis]|nr:hypothetical protein C9975_03490 [Thalassospira xiamenensis]
MSWVEREQDLQNRVGKEELLAPATAAIFCDYAEAEKMANIEIEYRQGRSNSLPDFAKPSCPAFQGFPTQTDNKGQIGFQF